MKAELILILFFAFCSLVLGIKYYYERKRYERCRLSNNRLNKKLKEYYEKYEN